MEKRIPLLVGTLVVVSMIGSVALALPPMGPPRATAGQGQWTIGIEYGRSEMDFEAFGDVRTVSIVPFDDYTRYDIDGLESNMIFGNLTYGIQDNLDVFLRLGAADAADEISEDPASGTGNTFTGLDGGLGFGWGVGTRATFWQDGDVTWGALVQATWLDPDDSKIKLKGDPDFSGTADFEIWQVQVAAGPTVQFDDFRIYGGPFVHFLGGDLDIKGQSPVPFTQTLTAKQDLREKSRFGGYFGVQWLIAGSVTCNVEAQATGDAWAVGVGAVWRTE